jgi:cytochrome c553
VKYRESFRPFAPSVLREDMADWFEMDADSPYMLLVAGVKQSRRREMTEAERALFGIDKLNIKRSEIPAVTHVDYSARIQSVHDETNPRYYALISRFKEKTGCPVVVNTSFNVRGEPIVCTPEDAFRCFMGTDIEWLACGNAILRKEAQDPAFPALAGQRREYLLASLRAFAAGERHSGTMQMVAAELGADWMAELADHYAALPPPRAQDPPAENELGAAIARLGIPARRVPSCADCHGPEADGAQAPRGTYPRLAGQHADYLVQQLQLVAEGRRGGTEFAVLMRELAHPLEPEERRAVAAFYAARAPSDGR